MCSLVIYYDYFDLVTWRISQIYYRMKLVTTSNKDVIAIKMCMALLKTLHYIEHRKLGQGNRVDAMSMLSHHKSVVVC